MFFDFLVNIFIILVKKEKKENIFISLAEEWKKHETQKNVLLIDFFLTQIYYGSNHLTSIIEHCLIEQTF